MVYSAYNIMIWRGIAESRAVILLLISRGKWSWYAKEHIASNCVVLTDLLLLAFLMIFSGLASSSSCTGYTGCTGCIDCIGYIGYIGYIGCACVERSASITRISAPSSAHCASITTLKVDNKCSASIARISAPSSAHYISIKILIIVLNRFDTDLITWPKVEILTKSIFGVYLNRWCCRDSS